MENAIIYGTQSCVFCDKAFNLLEENNFNVIKVDIASSKDDYLKIQALAGNFKSVPQIVINENYIGGYKDLEKFLEKI